MPALSTRVAAAAAALLLALTASSCSQDAQDTDGYGGHDHSESSGAGDAAHDAEDLTFVTNMIPHHQQAVDLTQLLPTRTDDTAMIDLASRIAEEQTPEIQTMQAMLAQWGQEVDAQADHGEHEGMAGMVGMVDYATMTRLESLNGQEFDRLWLQSMIAHHQGAIEMARTEVNDGQNADATTLAEHVITAQESEIAEMTEMLGA
ncbi:MAG: DUF305 domain-containing protein [Mycobacterium sp.]